MYTMSLHIKRIIYLYLLTKELLEKTANFCGLGSHGYRKNPSTKSIMKDTNIAFFHSVQHNDLVKRIKMILFIRVISFLSIAVFITLSFFYPIFIIPSSFLFIVFICVLIRGKIRVDYDFDNHDLADYNKRVLFLLELFRSSSLWQIKKFEDIKESKKYGGALSLVTKFSTKVKLKAPSYLKSRHKIFQIPLKNETLIFLPDIILVKKGFHIGVISYTDFKANTEVVPYVMMGHIPKDALIQEYTYKYVNKNGSPDKRFKDNTEIAICNLMEIHLTSMNGFDVMLLSSNLDCGGFE